MKALPLSAIAHMERCNFLIIGGGIAGSYCGHALAAEGDVVILEAEDRPGYHATGRSAAFYSETYGNRVVRALTSAGKEFFLNTPRVFSEAPLTRPRSALHIGTGAQSKIVSDAWKEASEFVPNLKMLGAAEVRDMVPVVREEYCASAYLEPDCHDIDVGVLHQGFLVSTRQQGGTLVTDARATGIRKRGAMLEVTTSRGSYEADIVLNAAGAWADEVAVLAGLPPIGFMPLRRTALTFEAPTMEGVEHWPLVIAIDESFYFKPDAGRLLATPGDETLSVPCDAQPEDIDVALTIDRVEKATELRIASVVRKWAGLRTFAPDRTPVVGHDSDLPGFFWVAGQGGYGMQTSPAISSIVHGLVTGDRLPEAISDMGIERSDLSPDRFRN